MANIEDPSVNANEESPASSAEDKINGDRGGTPDESSLREIELNASSPSKPDFLPMYKENKNSSQPCLDKSQKELQAEKAKELDAQCAKEEVAEVNVDVQIKPVEWRPVRLQLEPQDQTDSVSHEWSDCLRVRGIDVFGASVRGWLKAHEGKWRDDSCQFDSVDNWLIVAVADGGGSASLSRIGARVAVMTAVESLKKLLAGFRLAKASDSVLSDECMAQLRTFLSETCQQSISAIQQEAQSRQRSIKDFHTTFLILIQTTWKGHDIIGTIHVGDGQIGLLNVGNECELLIAPDHGQWAGEVVFLTSSEIEPNLTMRAKVRILEKPFRGIVVATDGVTDHFEPAGKFFRDIFLGDPISQELRLINQDGQPLKGLLCSIPSDCVSAGPLLNWLKFGQLEPDQAWDDRTLVLIRRKDTICR